MELLLGPGSSSALGGDVKAGIDAMGARVLQLRYRLFRLEDSLPPDGRHGGAMHPYAREERARYARLTDDLQRREKKLRTLTEAGQQLKDLWRAEGDWPAGVNACGIAVARLGLVGHLLGGTPMLICMSDRDFGGKLDLEIKFLATVADNQDGHLPPVDKDTDDWRQARQAFMRQ